MDPTSSYRETPKVLSPPSPTEYAATGHIAYPDDRYYSPKTDTTVEGNGEPDYISKISGACLRSLQQILQDTDSRLLQKREVNILRRVIGAFVLWDDGYGAQIGILDEKLKCSNQLYRTTLSLLRSLCKSTQYGKYLS
jgi:hypothetical protein